MNTKQAIQDYKQEILNATKYHRDIQPGDKVLSASSLANDTLQLWLQYKYGKGKEQQHIDANTFGSLLQLGIDCMLQDSNRYEIKKKLEYKLHNSDWIISGEIDVFDKEYNVIIDNKLTTQTAIEKIKKEKTKNNYILQMSVYKYLLKKVENIDSEAILAIFNKTYSLFKASNKYAPDEFMPVETLSVNETDNAIRTKIKELETYIELDSEPPKCANVFPFKQKNGSFKEMRCIHYCSFNHVCPYYQNKHPKQKFKDILGI